MLLPQDSDCALGMHNRLVRLSGRLASYAPPFVQVRQRCPVANTLVDRNGLVPPRSSVGHDVQMEQADAQVDERLGDFSRLISCLSNSKLLPVTGQRF